MIELPLFSVGDKLAFSSGSSITPVCVVKAVGGRNVQLEWIVGIGAEYGWKVEGLNALIKKNQLKKLSPVIEELLNEF